MATDVLSATRIHFPEFTDSIPEASEEHLRSYVRSTAELGVVSAIAVNSQWLVAEVKRIANEEAPELDLQVLHVPVWGAFVPALNTLLGEAQRRQIRYILYQSLEVRCPSKVLKLMMDHHTRDTLVVGPVLDGHVFSPGKQPLNGRSSPWNTLALWSTRKLSLTGFLSIADGIPDAEPELVRQISGLTESGLEAGIGFSPGNAGSTGGTPTMGSLDWWDRQVTDPTTMEAVPAGVEEVTAIAILQHLLGEDRARAILIELPLELDKLVSWKTNWQDPERKRWQEHKMASKVARPAAQVKHLLGGASKSWRWPSAFRPREIHPFGAALLSPGEQDVAQPEDVDEEPLHFGSVLHFGESISPAPEVEALCLVALALFSANFTAIFASAFRLVNHPEAHASAPTFVFLTFLIGGVYIAMPASLHLTRLIVSHTDHREGLMLFAGSLLFSHCCIVVWQSRNGSHQHLVLIVARFIQGIGSGILFQVRFVLASLSTQDQHLRNQARSFLATDVGLGIGALIPFLAAKCSGENELSATQPDLSSSALLAVLSLLLLLWVVFAFPRRLHRLPQSVRFPSDTDSAKAGGRVSETTPAGQATSGAGMLIASGTARVFVQSAAVFAVALWMRDVGLTGSFNQTKAVAILCLLPAVVEACHVLVISLRPDPIIATEPKSCKVSMTGGVATSTVGLVMIVFACSSVLISSASWNDRLPGVHVPLELFLLLVALAIAVPLNVTRLNRVKDAETSMAKLEWMKAYFGRLFGPMFAFWVQNAFGYGPLLALLCGATVFVAVTA